MKNKKFKKIGTLAGIIMILWSALCFVTASSVKAVTEGFAFAVSPMVEKILLNPGDQYTSSIKIYSNSEYTQDTKYIIKTAGFYIDDNNKKIFEECDERCDLADWITINSPTEGRLSPGEEKIIEYTIDVPVDAHGGGQYASIIVQGEPWVDEINDKGGDGEGEIKSAVKEEKRIAYTIYAEVTGDVVRQGEITDINVPSFLLSGDVKGAVAVKNTGNVHGNAIYKLQVFPLFSDEEIYTNEENPDGATILPDRTRYEETVWEQTPSMGVFNVVYTVEFEGVTAQVSKMVIKCPIWLIFVILFTIFALIFYFVAKTKAKKKAAKRAEKSV